jgi:hypothetical protein
MPGVTLHIVLADRAVRLWGEGAAPPPFDADDPVALNAYRHGAVGPDLGYFPGGDRVLSDLAHCVRTGALTRTLLRSASTRAERGFATGWLTHFLADVLIHPLIGRAVGELLTGSRETFVDGSSDLLGHVRVEVGLDAWYARRHPEVCRRRLLPALPGEEGAYLARAYASTYGVRMPAPMFARSLRVSSRRTRQALRVLPLIGALLDPVHTPVASALRRALRAAYRSEALRSPTLAFLNPVEPAAWLLDAVERAAFAHAEGVLRHVSDSGATLEDVNLDTGRPLAGEEGHLGTRRALDALGRLAA